MNNDNRLICQLMEKSNFIISSTSSSSSLNDSSGSDSTDIIKSSSSEDEDLLLFPLLKFLTSGQRKHRIENYLQLIDCWSNEEFKQHMRINRHTAQMLIGITNNEYLSFQSTASYIMLKYKIIKFIFR